MSDDLLVLFPGALGDFICFRPTLMALRATTRGRLAVVTHPSFFPLLPSSSFTSFSIDRAEIANLFASGPLDAKTRALLKGFLRALSWTGYGLPQFAERLARATGAEVTVYPFRGMMPGEHAAEYYARCAGVTPLPAPFVPSIAAQQWADAFWKFRGLTDRTLAIHPGSGSKAKNWLGITQVAAWWRRQKATRVLALLGPAELEHGWTIEADAEVQNQPLERVAALLQRSCAYLGNDSGISHLASAVGTPSVVAFGPTDPHIWQPLGLAVHVVRGRAARCAHCGDAFCTHRLSVEQVCRAIELAIRSRSSTRQTRNYWEHGPSSSP